MNTTENKVRPHKKTIYTVFIPLFSALIAICSWISIPFTVPFTMQTFAIFLTLFLLGGKNGTFSILLYLLLGTVGVPVFHNFTGGLGTLLGPTGGYLIGFVFTGLTYWGFTSPKKKNTVVAIIGALCGSLVCYAFGTAWFIVLSIKSATVPSLLTVLGWCVFPFIIPDLAKLSLAVFLRKVLHKQMLSVSE